MDDVKRIWWKINKHIHSWWKLVEDKPRPHKGLVPEFGEAQASWEASRLLCAHLCSQQFFFFVLVFCSSKLESIKAAVCSSLFETIVLEILERRIDTEFKVG